MCIFRVIKTINTQIPKYDQKNLQLRLPIIIYMTFFTCRANLDTNLVIPHSSHMSRTPFFGTIFRYKNGIYIPDILE